MQQKTILIILDGWGCGDNPDVDAIQQAQTPNIDRYKSIYPNSRLRTSGGFVGLPDGQMGNSEVGHLNIGAGRIVYQDLVRINRAIQDHSIEKNPMLVEAFTGAKEHDRQVHFIGLVSDGGVHSLNTHLYQLCDMTASYGLERVFIHAITDGRDTDPRSGAGFIEQLQAHLQHSNGKVASVIGRYYSMDRDKRWERIRDGYDLYVHGKGQHATDPVKAIEESYAGGITDEFIRPVVLVDDQDEPLTTIRENDVVICFNFRTDRLRQLTQVLTQQDMPEWGMKTIPLQYYTMARYDDNFKGIKVIFDKKHLEDTLGELVARSGKKQIRIAETEKYAHVTFFFSGGREEPFHHEKRILIPSPKVATYDLQPEMSAYKVKDAIVKELNQGEADFICLNFANGDMVGHTGIWPAIIKAVEAVDYCVGEVVEAARANGYAVLIIADHGNADYAINPDGSPNTAHSLNPVPCILVSDYKGEIRDGILADVAPTILKIMGMQQPSAMTGKALID